MLKYKIEKLQGDHGYASFYVLYKLVSRYWFIHKWVELSRHYDLGSAQKTMRELADPNVEGPYYYDETGREYKLPLRRGLKE